MERENDNGLGKYLSGMLKDKLGLIQNIKSLKKNHVEPGRPKQKVIMRTLPAGVGRLL